MPVFAEWPQWLSRLAWTAFTIGAAYGVGHVVTVVVGVRIAALARRTKGEWDDAIFGVLRRRIPFWSLLVGGYLSLAHWQLSLEGHEFAVRILSALGVASATFAAAAVATELVSRYGPRTGPTAPVSGLSQTIARIVVTILGCLVIVRSFGYDITPMLTALGVGGLAVALALQEPLSNLFAGIFIAIAGQVRIGDYIKIDSGAEGYVVDFNWRSTRLRAQADNLVVVPNAKLAQAVVTNFSFPTGEMGIGVDVTADRASDLSEIERVAREAAAEVAHVVNGAVVDQPPTVRYQGFTDLGVKFTVGLRVREFSDQALVRHELIKRLHARFSRDGLRVR